MLRDHLGHGFDIGIDPLHKAVRIELFRCRRIALEIGKQYGDGHLLRTGTSALQKLITLLPNRFRHLRGHVLGKELHQYGTLFLLPLQNRCGCQRCRECPRHCRRHGWNPIPQPKQHKTAPCHDGQSDEQKTGIAPGRTDAQTDEPPKQCPS